MRLPCIVRMRRSKEKDSVFRRPSESSVVQLLAGDRARKTRRLCRDLTIDKKEGKKANKKLLVSWSLLCTIPLARQLMMKGEGLEI